MNKSTSSSLRAGGEAIQETVRSMKRGGVLYIMASKRNGTLYTGVTSDLKRRVYEHKANYNPLSFTAKYSCTVLVYYRGFQRIDEAITEEKRIKGSNRKYKLSLIEAMNPEWKDLWEEVEKW